MMISNRRAFMKNTSLLSCLPFVTESLFARATETQFKTFYSVDEKNNLYLMNSMFPYEKKLLLSVGEVLDNSSVYEQFSKVLNVGQLTNSENPYLIIVSVENGCPVLYFGETQVTNFENSAFCFVGKLSPETLDNSGQILFSPYDQLVCPLIPNDQEKLENPNLQLSLVMMDKYNRTYKVIALEKENNSANFKSFPIQDFQLSDHSSLHALPKFLLDDSNSCFLVIDSLGKQHKYMRLTKNQEDKFYTMENLLILDDNTYLHNNWAFRFSSILNKNHTKNRGDHFHFIFQHGTKNKKSLVFLRPDNRLAALEFTDNNGTITPQVLAISENEYSPKNFYFCTILNHVENKNGSLEQKEVLLCKNKITQNCFLLSLENNSNGTFRFAENSISLDKTTDPQTQNAWNGFFSETGAEEFNYYLIPTKNHEFSVAFQILKHDRINDEKHLFEMNFKKSENHQSYVPVQLSFQFHKETSKKQKISLGDNYSSSDFWTDPYMVACLVVFGALGVCGIGALFCAAGMFCYEKYCHEENRSEQTSEADDDDNRPDDDTPEERVPLLTDPSINAGMRGEFPPNTPPPTNKKTKEQVVKETKEAIKNVLSKFAIFSTLEEPEFRIEEKLLKEFIGQALADTGETVSKETVVSIIYDELMGRKSELGYFYVLKGRESTGRSIPPFTRDRNGLLMISQGRFAAQNPYDAKSGGAVGEYVFDEKSCSALLPIYSLEKEEDLKKGVLFMELIRGVVFNVTTHVAQIITTLSFDRPYEETEHILNTVKQVKSVKLLETTLSYFSSLSIKLSIMRTVEAQAIVPQAETALFKHFEGR